MNASSPAALHLNASNFARVVADQSKPVLVDFWAPWCPPCRMIAPTIDQLAAETAGTAVVGKLDVEEASQIASQYQVQSIPTILIFRNGQEVDRLVGVRSKQELHERLLKAKN